MRCGIFGTVPLSNFIFCSQQKRKLRLYISNTFNPAKPDAEDSDGSIASWELRVEGKLLDDVSQWIREARIHSHVLIHISVSRYGTDVYEHQQIT